MIETGTQNQGKPESPKKYLKLNRDSMMIFLFGVAAFTVLPVPEFISFNARFALFAQEMFRNGPTFFPTTYQIPYPDYPGTSTFLIYMVSLLFGRVTPFTVALPTAIAASLILMVTYRIASIRSREWGLYAVIILFFTYPFLDLSRGISLDLYTSLATVLCFYIIYSSTVYGTQKRLLFVPLVFTAGFAFRGPIGLIVPAAITCGYYLFNKDLKKFFLFGFLSIILLAVCGTGLLAAAYVQGGETFVKKVVESQIFSRIGETNHGITFYWIQASGYYSLAYPFAIIVFIALFRQILRKENDDYKLLGHLAVWILIVLVGMTIPSSKHMRYILPIVPAIAMAGAYIFIEASRNDFLSFIKNLFLQVCHLAPILTGMAVLSVLVFRKWIMPDFGIYYLTTLVLMLVLIIAGRISKRRAKDVFELEIRTAAIGVLTFIVIIICIEEPVLYSLEHSRPFVEKVELMQKEKPGPLVFYKINEDAEAIKFLVTLDKAVKAEFTKSPDDIQKYSRAAYFISKKKDFLEIPQDTAKYLKLLHQGKIGHKECVVFVVNK